MVASNLPSVLGSRQAKRCMSDKESIKQQLKVVFLGTGTSQGVPIIGGTYSADYLANPKNHRTRPSIYIETSEVSIIVDTTPEMRIQVLREGIANVDAVLITHAHADHIMGMDDCRRFCHQSEKPLPIYAGAESMKSIQRVFEYAFNTVHIPKGYFVPDPRIVDGPFHVGDLKITPAPLPHGRMTSNGYIFSLDQKPLLAYLTDCKEVPENIIHQIQDLPVAVLDALRFKPHPTHMCYDEALTTARRIRAGQTWLTHLTHDYDHDLHQAELPSQVGLAYDGLSFRINSDGTLH
jgi:phosphoribosyl 1,2-cyclic phosphate phosphodiesterase